MQKTGEDPQPKNKQRFPSRVPNNELSARSELHGGLLQKVLSSTGASTSIAPATAEAGLNLRNLFMRICVYC